MLNSGAASLTPSVATVWYGSRGVFGGGHTGSSTNVIDYITIATTGNATDFGDRTLLTATLVLVLTAVGVCSVVVVTLLLMLLIT